MEELHAIYDELKRTAPKHCKMEFMGTDCIWLFGRTMKELRLLAEPLRSKYPDFEFKVDDFGGKRLRILYKTVW